VFEPKRDTGDKVHKYMITMKNCEEPFIPKVQLAMVSLLDSSNIPSSSTPTHQKKGRGKKGS